MRNRPGTETLKQQNRVVYGNAIIRAHFVILRRFQCFGIYQAIGDKTVKTQPRHIHSIPNDRQCFEGTEEL